MSRYNGASIVMRGNVAGVKEFEETARRDLA
jgi:hypothetical protein